jgi:hypothetical protein
MQEMCQLVEVYGKDVMRQQSITKWYVEFWGGKESTEDCEGSDRSTTARTAGNTALTGNEIGINRSITMRELQHDLNLLHGTPINIIHNLRFDTVRAHWVPGGPTEDHKK